MVFGLSGIVLSDASDVPVAWGAMVTDLFFQAGDLSDNQYQALSNHLLECLEVLVRISEASPP